MLINATHNVPSLMPLQLEHDSTLNYGGWTEWQQTSAMLHWCSHTHNCSLCSSLNAKKSTVTRSKIQFHNYKIMFVCSSVECKTRKYSCGVSVYRGLASFSPQLSISQAKQTHHPINLSTHDFLKWVYYLQGTFNATLYDISDTPLEPACKVLSHLCLQSSGKPVIWQPFHLYNAVLLWVCIATYLSHFHIFTFTFSVMFSAFSVVLLQGAWL